MSFLEDLMGEMFRIEAVFNHDWSKASFMFQATTKKINSTAVLLISQQGSFTIINHL